MKCAATVRLRSLVPPLPARLSNRLTKWVTRRPPSADAALRMASVQLTTATPLVIKPQAIEPLSLYSSTFLAMTASFSLMYGAVMMRSAAPSTTTNPAIGMHYEVTRLYWLPMPFDVRDFPGAPPEDRAAGRQNRRKVAFWLFGVAGMVLIMIVLGGVTRLTGAGLSIMEWAPFRGTLPPMSDAEWLRLFRLYQQIPQYALINEGIGLAGFKQIFWLEWSHRLWGRLTGVAFLGPLIWFWATGRLERRLRPRLLVLFILGGLQGAVGWFMVESGFLPDTTAVSAYRLVVHLALALVLYAALLWTGLTVLRPLPAAAATSTVLHRLAGLCCASVALTMLAGGFVAGTHAGLTYNTFPLMDGRLIPPGYGQLEPLWRNLAENVAAVQFDHRLLATLTVLTAACTLVIGFGGQPSLASRCALVAFGIAVLVQYLIGVTTLLLVVPVGLAAMHQAVGTLVLTAAIVLLHTARPARAGQRP
jgi:heme a synthase